MRSGGPQAELPAARQPLQQLRPDAERLPEPPLHNAREFTHTRLYIGQAGSGALAVRLRGLRAQVRSRVGPRPRPVRVAADRLELELELQVRQRQVAVPVPFPVEVLYRPCARSVPVRRQVHLMILLLLPPQHYAFFFRSSLLCIHRCPVY